MKLTERSKQVRRDTIALSKANGGYHYGGCFSVTEILIALYDYILDAEDMIILSKGHSCWPYYVLLREKGYDPKLMGHPSIDIHNGIHFTTGSEGHGLPAGIGMALAKKAKKDSGKVFVIMGDGECQEGTTWESLLIAAKHTVNNLIAIVDWNEIQGSGRTKDILPLPNFTHIVSGIGWSVTEVDGHNVKKLTEALAESQDRPLMIIAKTVKGKGVSFMEGVPEWHAKWLDDEHEQIALKELR